MAECPSVLQCNKGMGVEKEPPVERYRKLSWRQGMGTECWHHIKYAIWVIICSVVDKVVLLS